MLNLEVIGQGATTKIYRDGNTAIKLYVNAPPDEAENEAERQRFALNAGLPVPVVFGVRRLDNNVVALDMEYVNGRPLIHQKMDKDERREAIKTLVCLQCSVYQVNASGLPKQRQRLSQRITQTPLLNDEVKNRLLTLLSELDTGAVNLCHGDFHPLNILFDGKKYWIIDWVDATAGNPLADACRTYLIFKQYMTRAAGIYLKTFCDKTKARQEEILAWIPVIAAGRLHENLDDKARAWLLEQIM
jgi:aminoglycoside phosphotransferase (APT) family kinase protein